MSAAKDFQQAIGAKLASRLDNNVTFSKTRLCLTWPVEEGRNIVVLGGSNKWSPHLHVAFHFGCWFSAAGSIERLVSVERAPHMAHIGQYSLNAHQMTGLDYQGPSSWRVDIREPPSDLIESIAGAVRGIAFPFFERFKTLRLAREALIEKDRWCISTYLDWSSMLYLDAAIGDLKHFAIWARGLPEFYRKLAEHELAQVTKVLRQQSNNALDSDAMGDSVRR